MSSHQNNGFVVLKSSLLKEFSGSPVVWTLHFYCKGHEFIFIWASQVALVVKKKKNKKTKNPPTNAGDIKDTGSIPGSGRTPGGGHGNPLQYACLENPMDRGARRNTVHRVAKSETQLK